MPVRHHFSAPDGMLGMCGMCGMSEQQKCQQEQQSGTREHYRNLWKVWSGSPSEASASSSGALFCSRWNVWNVRNVFDITANPTPLSTPTAKENSSDEYTRKYSDSLIIRFRRPYESQYSDQIERRVYTVNDHPNNPETTPKLFTTQNCSEDHTKSAHQITTYKTAHQIIPKPLTRRDHDTQN